MCNIAVFGRGVLFSIRTKDMRHMRIRSFIPLFGANINSPIHLP